MSLGPYRVFIRDFTYEYSIFYIDTGLCTEQAFCLLFLLCCFRLGEILHGNAFSGVCFDVLSLRYLRYFHIPYKAVIDNNSLGSAFAGAFCFKHINVVYKFPEKRCGQPVRAAKATNKTDCAWRRVKEDEVYAAFNLMIRKVQANREYLLGTLIRQLEELQYRTTGSQQRIKEIDREIADLTAQNLVLSRLHGKGVLNVADYVSDCISKRIKANNGERNKYYIENNHPAIIDAGTFARVQEEIARRSGKPKVKQKGTKTELSRYSSKYALSELLICGECRTPYRRCTWTAKGKRKIVWRCINRLDYGKKYCHHSPSIEESLLQDAVMRAIMQTAKQNIEVLKTLKIHIGMGLTDEVTEDKTLDIQIRIAEIDAEFQKMLKAVSADNADGIDEERITELMNEKQGLTVQLEQYATMRQKRESAKSRLDEIFTILDGLQNHQMKYDDKLVRQIIECVVVESKEKIKVVFIGGTEIEMTL